MKRKILFLFFVFTSTVILAQELPLDFDLSKKSLSKISDATPASNTIERILFQGNTIWLATSKGLSKSTDNGNTWINYYKTEPFAEENVSAVAYGDGTIWAATWHFETKIGDEVPVGTGLRYSTDDGNTWTKIGQPVDNPDDSSIVYGINTLRALPVIVKEQNFIYDIELTNNTIWIASFAGGLRKSTDKGVTWQRVVLPPDNLNSIKPTDTLHFSLQPVAGSFGSEEHLNHRVFSIYAVDDDTIYVGTAGGINKSMDGGISWVKFNRTNQSNPISGNFILALDYNKYDKSIWAATWKAEGITEYWGVSSSNDGGQNWKTFLTDERVLDFGFEYYGTPGSYTHADIFAASQNGLYRSNNNGTTWIAAPEIIDDNTFVSLNTKHFRAVEVKQENDAANIWIGSLNGLARLTESYSLWEGSWKVYLASEQTASANESYAFPNPFSPDEEGVNIKYSLNEPANVTIRILDFGMNLVRTVIQNVPKTGNSEQVEIWDGKDQNGKIVPNGVYFYRIDFGSGEPLFGKILVIM